MHTNIIERNILNHLPMEFFILFWREDLSIVLSEFGVSRRMNPYSLNRTSGARRLQQRVVSSPKAPDFDGGCMQFGVRENSLQSCTIQHFCQT